MKRFGLVLLLLTLLASTLLLAVGCEETPQEQPPQPEMPMVDIITGGATEYAIVRPTDSISSDPDVKAAVRLRAALKEATGCNLQIKEDYKKDDASENYEILLGRTNRPETAQLPETLEPTEYVILFTGKKILIDAGSELAMDYAVTSFLTAYLGYDEATGKYAKSDLAIPEKLNLKATCEDAKIVYLIGDIRHLGNGGDNPLYLDIVRLITCLQGRVNKNADTDNIYIYQLSDDTDKFWLDYISEEGKLLSAYYPMELMNWGEVWRVFGDTIKETGIVLWDPEVPSTANVAATICSVEGYLPVCCREEDGSLYEFLIAQGVPVKMTLVDKFTGEGKIPDTNIDSTGSIKCDPYIWAYEFYIDKCNPNMLAYTLDGASAVPGNHIYETAESTGPQYNQLYSHDYLISNECFFIDLTCIDFEKPCDDPDQPMGTDAKTLHKILKHYYDANNGKMTKLMGFPPWYMKYTTFRDHGSVVATTLEWEFVEVLSQYNFIKEADAAHPAWMTNGSVYCNYKPTVDYFNYAPAEELEFEGNVRYFTIYMGDYDSSAWLKKWVPTFFDDDRRGDLPLMWSFNPNLADRVPMVFDYVYEHATPNDYFVTGDSGAGYVIPSLLPDLDIWVDFNEPYLDKFDMDIVGFIINGNNKMTNEIFAAYAKIAPVGSFHNDSSQKLTIYDGETVYMHLMNGIDPSDQENAVKSMYQYATATGNNFSAYRTICKSPTEVFNCVEAFIEYANAKNDGYTYQYVDPYTLFDLVLQSGQGDYIY